MFYRMTLKGEELIQARIEMTMNEAIVIDKISKRLTEKIKDSRWVNSCEIDLDSPTELSYPDYEYRCKICGRVWEGDINPSRAVIWCPECEAIIVQ